MIGYGNGFHVEFDGSFKKRIESDSTVQKTVLGMNVEVYEVGGDFGHGIFNRVRGFKVSRDQGWLKAVPKPWNP